jgi:hypothetical protein
MKLGRALSSPCVVTLNRYRIIKVVCGRERERERERESSEDMQRERAQWQRHTQANEMANNFTRGYKLDAK